MALNAPLGAYPASIARQHEAFVRWTRAQGLGPELHHERECLSCAGEGVHISWVNRGDEDPEAHTPCRSCWGYRRLPDGDLIGDGTHRGWPGKLARQWGGDSRAPMGRSLARLGRHILDMLDAAPGSMWGHARYQPSECQTCGPLPWDKACWARCPDCSDGHNLRGVLPAVEWSPQIRRRAREVHVYRSMTTPHCWLDEVPTHTLAGPDVTRVVARGEQEFALTDGKLRDQRRGADWAAEVDRCSRERYLGEGDGDYGTQSDAHVWAWRLTKLPGWRRGKHKHAEQRRAKAAYRRDEESRMQAVRDDAMAIAVVM